MIPVTLPLLALLATLAAGSSNTSRPNFVLFLQDDQDLVLGGWTPMNKTKRLLADQGMVAKNWFIHTPVCCPSRAELLSGRYFHNVRMSTPKGGCMHADTDKVNANSFGGVLGDAGYSLGWFGKHLNQCPHTPPPGWGCPTCYWFANGGGADNEPGGYLNATFSDFAGGKPVAKDRYHSSAGTYKADTTGEFAGYTTAVIANKSIAWLRDVASKHQPFMMTVASKGPHVPATPAPWYASGTWIDGLSAPRTPDYNASKAQLANHHWLIAQQGPITEAQGVEVDQLFRDRWKTLLSIDDAIAAVVEEVESLGLMESTYFIVTSDHGYNLGQHRLPSCKLNVYDHAIRIPMVIRGPGVKPGSSLEQQASNVDVGPTLLGLAGLSSSTMDGRSVAPLIIDSSVSAVTSSTSYHLQQQRRQPTQPWRDFHLVEYYSLGDVVRTGHLVDDPKSNTYRALRFTKSDTYGDLLYSEFTAVDDWQFERVSFYEVFNMTTDPHQLNNIYHTLGDQAKAALAAQVAEAWKCSGTSGAKQCA